MNELPDGQHLEFIAGLDLGQASDYTALAVLKRFYRFGSEADTVYELPTLYRWPTGTSYPQIVADVAQGLRGDSYHCQRLKWNGAYETFSAPITLVIDGTGVGRGVVDMFREADLRVELRAVTITGGDAVSHLDVFDRVPKRDLVGAVQVVLQTGRLKIAPGLREARTLLRELQNFRMKITDKAHDTYGAWRDGEHDDLVLAVSLALWSGEHFGAPATPEEQQEMVDALTNYTGR